MIELIGNAVKFEDENVSLLTWDATEGSLRTLVAVWCGQQNNKYEVTFIRDIYCFCLRKNNFITVSAEFANNTPIAAINAYYWELFPIILLENPELRRIASTRYESRGGNGNVFPYTTTSHPQLFVITKFPLIVFSIVLNLRK